MDIEVLISLAELDLSEALDQCCDDSLFDGDFDGVNRFFRRLTEHHLEDMIDHPSIAVSFLTIAPGWRSEKYPARTYFYNEFKKAFSKCTSKEEAESLLYGLEP